MSLKTKIESLLGKWLQRLLQRISTEDGTHGNTPGSRKGGTGGDAQDRAGDPSGSAPPAHADAVPFDALEWCYGGFNGKNAQLADGCRISDLRVGGGKMSYRWAEGDCAPLGGPVKSDAVCIAALFCLGEDGKWRGGKFEWIGTSRTSRSLGNCDGYHGWQMSAVDAAQAYAFVIVSRNGKARSNVIVQGG